MKQATSLKTKFRSIILVCMTAFLSVGCASKNGVLSQSERDSFYVPPTTNQLAAVYLTCGKIAKDGDYDAIMLVHEVAACSYIINGTGYYPIKKDEVARLDLPVGQLSINNSGNLEPGKSIEIKSNEKILLESGYNHITKPGAYFGLVGALVQAAADALYSGPLPVIYPLIIYKNDFNDKISHKTPIKLNPVVSN